MKEKTIEVFKKHKEQIMYLIFGGLTTLANLVLYYIFTRVFGMSIYSSTIMSWVLAVLFAYVTNRMFVFESKNKNKIKEMVFFYGFRFLSLLFDLGFMWLMVDALGIHDLISKIIVNVGVIILNYIFSKLFIFKGEK